MSVLNSQATESGRPVRILQVVGGMNRAGVETWLMHVLRNIDRTRYSMDFLVHSRTPGAYDDELRALGSRTIYCGPVANPVRYATRFVAVNRQYGPYDVVHSHVHMFSGYVSMLARASGVPVRIVHSHSDTTVVDTHAGPVRNAYHRLCRSAIRRHATQRLAVSDMASLSLFGSKAFGPVRLLPCGVDPRCFDIDVDRAAVRAEAALSPHDFVLCHVGRFESAKNHLFLIDVFAAVIRQCADAKLVLIGDGPLRGRVQEKAASLGVIDRIRFLGARDDVPRLLIGIADVFVFPSLFEGLGMAVVEAQAAGLPCVVSGAVPALVQMPYSAMTFVSDYSVSAWVGAIESTRCKEKPTAVASSINASPFALQTGIQQLQTLYGSRARQV